MQEYEKSVLVFYPSVAYRHFLSKVTIPYNYKANQEREGRLLQQLSKGAKDDIQHKIPQKPSQGSGSAQ
jgi:hypothetical protein